jgi:glutamyl-tRNA synthetase
MNARVRFSVRATGRLSIGDARIALLSWLFARHEGGAFTLCVEDVVARPVSGAVRAICEALRWLGLNWDEGPVLQSERLASYARVAWQLVETGRAYPCYCAPDEISSGVRCCCHDLTVAERAAREAQGVGPAVRFSVPGCGEVTLNDGVLGAQSVRQDALGDVVLLTADGLPMHILSGVVDDHDASITHVVRSRSHLPGTPVYLSLCQALRWDAPQFAHLPSVAWPDEEAPGLDAYRKAGYLAPAVVNDLARLGWAPRGKRELLSLAALAERFELRRVSHSSPVPDPRQLDWFNRRALSQLDAASAARLMAPYWQAAYGMADSAQGTALTPGEWQAVMALSILGEVGALSGGVAAARFAFADEVAWDAQADPWLDQPYAAEVLGAFSAGIVRVAPYAFEPIDAFVSALRWRFKALYGVRSRDVMHLIRVALTGRAAGPCLVDVCRLLGAERCAERVRKALDRPRTSRRS